MLGEQQFETPEDVAIEYQVATPVSRFTAYCFDRLILLLIQLVVVLFFYLGLVATAIVEQGSAILPALALALLGFSELIYFGYFEWRRHGSTPGKRAVGLRAMREGGYSLTADAAWLRNLFRLVDLFPPLWLVPLLDRRSRRLGDLVAGTIVVHERRKKSVQDPLEEWSYAQLEERPLSPTRVELLRLSWEDYQALQGFFDRLGDFEEKTYLKLARSLARKLLMRMERSAPSGVSTTDLLREIYLALRDSPGLLDELAQRRQD